MIGTLLAVLPCLALLSSSTAWLTDVDRERFKARHAQTNLRGPRMPGSLEQSSFIDSIASSMRVVGAQTSTLNYTMYRWDPRWWAITAHLDDDSEIWIPTVGYYPYSGDTGLSGVTGRAYDAGSFAVDPTTMKAEFDALDLSGVQPGDIVFFDNPPVTVNYSTPQYSLLGTSRGIDASEIPEIGNVTDPHHTGLAKVLNFTTLQDLQVGACISSWTGISDENAALLWEPKSDLPGEATQHVPTLYVGESTGEMIRGMIQDGKVKNMTVMLDAPSFNSDSATLIAHLPGTAQTDDSILLYSHSDGMNIIEENGGLVILSMIEYFAKNPINLNIDVVIITGHLSSGHLNETAWMGPRGDIMQNAKAALAIEHIGPKEWNDRWENGQLVWEDTGRDQAMFTYANVSSKSDFIRQAYLEALEDSPEQIRMPLIGCNVDPETGEPSKWPGVGGASILGFSDIPTLGIEVQPDWLWKFFQDGGWSRFDADGAIAETEAFIKTTWAVDQAWQNGTLLTGGKKE